MRPATVFAFGILAASLAGILGGVVLLFDSVHITQTGATVDPFGGVVVLASASGMLAATPLLFTASLVGRGGVRA